jgi:hypothetical protein
MTISLTSLSNNEFSYEDWASTLKRAVTNNDEDELYSTIDDIFSAAHHAGYCDGFGAGKVCCGGSCCECEENE